ncbi:hypothetical protein LrDSM24759_10900 [Lactobacillus rodentium]|uniref:Uncharacterized protein n=1 Tax=Lactobacillus rodentium TaxID=947835 RepID=A0A2Z6T7F7_9LACO|nr:hypothetical protein LrDSM24759_10900 [Lactobacillus rodentium]
MGSTLVKGFNHVGLRLHFVNAFVCDVRVSFANLHRSPRQIKNAAQLLKLWKSY